MHVKKGAEPEIPTAYQVVGYTVRYRTFSGWRERFFRNLGVAEGFRQSRPLGSSPVLVPKLKRSK